MNRFLRDTRAGIAVPMALISAMMFVMVGLAVDGSRAFLARDKFQAALDAAALAVGTTYDDDAALDALATDFVARNFDMSGATVNLVDVTATTEDVVVVGNFDLDTYFVQVFARDKLTLSAQTEVKRAGGGLMVALVLDNTGSMWSSNNIGSLRGAAQALVDDVFDGKTQEDDLRFAIVPYAAAVNPGSVADDLIAVPRPYGLSSQTEETAWKGCVSERWGSDSLADTPASTAPWTPYYYPDGVDNNYTPGDGVSIVPGGVKNSNQITGPNIGCPSEILPLTSYKSQVDAALSAMTAWNRGGTLTDIGMAWGIRVLSPGAPYTESANHLDVKNNQPIWTSPRWRRAIVLMTDGESSFYNFPGGGASNQEGTSPNSSHPSASDYTAYGRWNEDGSNAKAIFSSAPGYVRANGTTDNSTRGKLNRRIFDLCETAKSQGIVVYTVVFTSSVGSDTREMYRACASDPGKYWYAPTQTALTTAFEQVGSDLSKLRITR
ncbi:MAG: pilus assembly protein [Hyphomonadaceae bacterium]|nr:pilus assembly protein [Hyphomonadaceae bacterium]